MVPASFPGNVIYHIRNWNLISAGAGKQELHDGKIFFLHFTVQNIELYCSFVSNTDGKAQCREPSGVEGDVVEVGCFKMTCTATAMYFKMGMWLKSPKE